MPFSLNKDLHNKHKVVMVIFIVTEGDEEVQYSKVNTVFEISDVDWKAK